MHPDSYATVSYGRPPVQSPASPFLLFSFLAPFSYSASRGPLLFSFLAPTFCSASKGPLLFSFLASTSCSASRSPASFQLSGAHFLFSLLAPTFCSILWQLIPLENCSGIRFRFVISFQMAPSVSCFLSEYPLRFPPVSDPCLFRNRPCASLSFEA